MKVIVPFTPDKLRCETVEALRRYAPHAVMVSVAGNNQAYAALVEELWGERETFAIVEHDVEIHAHALADFTDCREPWCANGYNVGESIITHGLGCTRFRSELMEAEPDAVTAHQALGPGGVPARDWRRLDVRLTSVLRTRGYEVCEHLPPVTHLHEYPPVAR